MSTETLDNILGEALEAAGVYLAAGVTGAKMSPEDWASFVNKNKTGKHRGIILVPCGSLNKGQIKLIR